MRCQQTLSGAANSGNSTVAHNSYKDVGFTVYCTGCDLVVLDDSFCRVQLLNNISGCRERVSAVTVCPSSGRIAALCHYSVYILAPTPTAQDDEFPYRWAVDRVLSIGAPVTCAAFSGSSLILTGRQLLIYSTDDWTCLWSNHLTEEAIQLTVSPDGRFFTTLSENSSVLKLWKKRRDGKEYRNELIRHPGKVIGASWRQISPELPLDSVRQVLLTSCADCVGRIWLETPNVHSSFSGRQAVSKSFVLGTVLDPLKEANEKGVDGSPYIFQWFNNKATSYSVYYENAYLHGEELLAERLSVSSYDIAVEEDFILSDNDQPSEEPVTKELLELRTGKVMEMNEFKYTTAQLLKLWFKTFDLVVCVSPVTGSLMGWRVEKIDVAYPFQALTTRFVLRLPWSLSYADARQLKHEFVVFSSRRISCNGQRERSKLRSSGKALRSHPTPPIALEGTLVDLRTISPPAMCLMTSHQDGTVNLFTFEMGVDDVTFTDISNLVHEVRCSGHRCPPITSTSHPYIPLVLTTSSETGALASPGYGELILWRVSCIGPMTTRKTGILELARVDTDRAADFTAVSWFPKAFSVQPHHDSGYTDVLISFVLHFVAFTGHSLELYRVITLSESIQTAKLLLDRSSSAAEGGAGGVMMGEGDLRSKSSGTGASKIYHVGRIAEVGEGTTCALLHTFSAQTVTAARNSNPEQVRGSTEELEEYYVVLVDKAEGVDTARTIKVTVSKEEEAGGLIEEPQRVQPLHNSFFCARWEDLESAPLPLPPSIRLHRCSPAASTVATPKFLPPGTRSPYLFSGLCGDGALRCFALDGATGAWSTWPTDQVSPLRVEGSNLENLYLANSIPGRLALTETCLQAGLTVSFYECESSGGAAWALEDRLVLDGTKNNSGPVFLDFMSAANGCHILALVQADSLWILTPCSCTSLHTTASSPVSSSLASSLPSTPGLPPSTLLQHQPSTKVESWVPLLRAQLGAPGVALPRSLSWNSTGSLLLGINTELQLYSPWYTQGEVTVLETHAHLERGVGNVFNDALALQPRLPQYHPYVLRQLIDARKVPEVKLILHYLLRYLVSYERSSKHRQILPADASLIKIIPPLPLHDLNNMSVDLFTGGEEVSVVGEEVDYSALLNTTTALGDSDDEAGVFSDEEEHTFIRRRCIAHSESEYDVGWVFDKRRAEDLDAFLGHYQLPGLTRGEQLSLSCLAITVGSTIQSFSDSVHAEPQGQDLDDCGLRFTLEMRYQSSVSRRSGKVPLAPHDFIWAYHSSCQGELIELIPGFKEKSLSWEDLRAVGVGWWVRSGPALKNLIEIVCKTRFQATKNPLECALFYLAMRKKTLLQSLYRTVRDTKMSDFLKHDFTEARWRTAAKKNAFVLLGQQRYTHAAAFFLLGDALEDALDLILKYCGDPQLALVVARLYEEPQNAFPDAATESNVSFKRVLSSHILGRGMATGDSDPFRCSMAHWWLGEYQNSLYCLLRPVTISTAPRGALPHIFSFYCYLHNHPVLKRCKEPVTLPFDPPSGMQNDVHTAVALERQLIFMTAYTQFNMGCPSLSLDVLRHLEKGFTRVTRATVSGTRTGDDQITTGMLGETSGGEGAMTLTATATPAFELQSSANNLGGGSSANNLGGGSSAGNMDWLTAGPVTTSSRFAMDDEYEIDFSSSDDSDDSDGSEEDPTTTDIVEVTLEEEETEETEEEEEDDGMRDPFIVQIQLKCCIKILADELRFLPHALLEQFDPELGPFGGRARIRSKMDSGATHDGTRSPTSFPAPLLAIPGANRLGLKVCQWLKLEIDTISRLCNLSYGPGSPSESDDDDRKTVSPGGEEDLTGRFEMEESILSVLLLFCILHGDMDYNLAALRLELLFLLQEFHNAGDMGALIVALEAESSSVDLPPLLTTTAPPPLLLTPLNMLWQLTGHTLKLINRCSVQHNLRQPEVAILNSLSLSASACMWQCLALRHGSSRIPNSYAYVKHQPLSWPGLSGNSVFFLVSAGKAFLVHDEKEGALPIAVVLVEAIVSVYLGLFVHAIVSSDAALLNQLMDNAPSPEMWTKVTGTTVQSVDTSPRPGAHRRSVGIMGERPIRVKSPRMQPSDSVVTVKETYFPPSMSLVEWFRKEHPVDTSNMFEVDSEYEETLDDDGDDAEDPFCYSWHLIRLMCVWSVRERLGAFLEGIGLTAAEIAGMSPLLANTLKTLDRWVEQLEDQMTEGFPEGPPEDLLPPNLPGYTLAQSLADPSCSPFRVKSEGTLAARVLWHKLATNTGLVEYLRPRDAEVDASECSVTGTRTIFRAQEGVSSFGLYHNSLSVIVVATLHEILELDVKTCLERDRGLREESVEEGANFIMVSTDDQSGSGSKPGSRLSSQMSQISQMSHHSQSLLAEQSHYGSEQSLDVFNQVLKRPEQGVRCIQAHNDLPLYITGHADGFVKLWEFGYPHHLAKYGLKGGRGRVTNVRFGPLGAKFGLSDTNGVIGFWHTTVSATTPFCVLNCHDRGTRDFAFIGCASVIGSVGTSSTGRNVVFWDTLLPPAECAVKKFQAHEMGAMVCCYSPKRQIFISGGNKGDICIFDVRQRKLQHMFTGHDSAIRSICLSPDEESYFTGSAEGDIKSWTFGGNGDQHSFSFSEGHKSTKFFSNLPGGSLKGVMKVQVDSANRLISCGADGEVKVRNLTNI